MSSDKIVLLFDVIVLIFGLYACAAALRMKKTGIPSGILIPKAEQPCLKNAAQFCGKMYQPTIFFGCMSCVYGLADLLNRCVLKLPYVDLLSMVCFLGVCYWYIRKLLVVKAAHL